jgi:hypothetical protein
MTFGRYAVTDAYISHQCADLHDITREFVSDDEGRTAPSARPRVPFVDMNVGPAHARTANADEYFIAAYLRLWHVCQFKSASRGAFYERFHARRLLNDIFVV